MTCVMFFQIVLICLSVSLSSQLTWLNSKSKFCLLWGGQWLKSLFLYFSFSVAAWNLPHACVLHEPAKDLSKFCLQKLELPSNVLSPFQGSSHQAPVAVVEPMSVLWFLNHKMAGSYLCVDCLAGHWLWPALSWEKQETDPLLFPFSKHGLSFGFLV